MAFGLSATHAGSFSTFLPFGAQNMRPAIPCSMVMTRIPGVPRAIAFCIDTTYETPNGDGSS